MADNMNIENLEKGQDAAETVGKIAQEVDIARQTSATAFNALNSINPDLGSHFNEQLRLSLDDIYKFLKESIYDTANEYYKIEEDDDDDNGGNDNNYGNPIYYGNGEPDVTIPDTVPESIPVVDPETIIKNISLKELEEVSLSDLYGLVIQLVGLIDPTKETLDEIFASDVNDDKIKQIVLESPYVPKELKEAITDLDSKVVKQLIYNILMGKNPEVFELNNLNKVAFYKYLEVVAMNNETTVEELLTNPDKAQLLKDSMAGLGDAIELIKGWEEQSNEAFQEQLKMFYYGDVPSEFPDQDIYVSRAYVDYLSTECDVNYEELLNDSSYAEILKQGAQEFGKSLTFFNSASFFSKETMQKNIDSSLKDLKIKEHTFVEAEPVLTDSSVTTFDTTNMVNEFKPETTNN